jgi:phage baseplate assembly protein W|tara:strand:- start:442 stop:879 length:438 start_codon:yes stop_codon:yes gene_type:complete
MALTPNSFTDASASKSRSTRVYKDVSLSFTRHPITGDIAKLTDADAVKRSVRNLINTDFYERPFHPEIGSDIRKTLFEPVDVSTAENLAIYVEDCIVNFEPRVELISVRVDANIDRNAYNIVIQFYLVNSPDGLIEMDIELERLR